MNPRVLAAAKSVRSNMETYALYLAVTKDADIDVDDLRGACGIASWVLWRALRRGGVDAHLVVGFYYDEFSIDHAWVRVGDTIVDVTATQFDDALPEVVVTSAKDDGFDLPYNRYRSGGAFMDGAAVARLRNWEDQSPMNPDYRQDLAEIERLAVAAMEIA